ncbi:putative 7-deoxyloganetin glucosyltransferase [Helianthus annuus]|nr:putative 7-deoxyloganetin glucosyltransferase [Helianthus annuus]
MHTLRDSIRQLTKGASTVSEFGRKFKSLCDQLAAIGHPITEKTNAIGSFADSALRLKLSPLPNVPFNHLHLFVTFLRMQKIMRFFSKTSMLTKLLKRLFPLNHNGTVLIQNPAVISRIEVVSGARPQDVVAPHILDARPIVLMDRIPTKKALSRRNVNCGDGLCSFCEEFEETVDHIFTACLVATGVWNAIARWVGLPQFYFFSVADILHMEYTSSWSKEKKMALHGVLVISCWRIWRARNERIFKNERRTAVDIVADIKALGFLWFSSRYKKGLVDQTYLEDGYLDTPIDFIPTVPGIRLKDIPPFVRHVNPGDEFMVAFSQREIERAKSAPAIIFNTFDELECDILDVLSLKFPFCYGIGPLSLLENNISDKSLDSIKSNLWVEDPNCLKWLDAKEPLSVIYVNFGSVAVMTPQQLVEFCWGLAKRNYSFLWIIRPDLVIGDSAVLPPEFLAETSNRGLLASWCPQEQGLNHPSIGGF